MSQWDRNVTSGALVEIPICMLLTSEMIRRFIDCNGRCTLFTVKKFSNRKRYTEISVLPVDKQHGVFCDQANWVQNVSADFMKTFQCYDCQNNWKNKKVAKVSLVKNVLKDQIRMSIAQSNVTMQRKRATFDVNSGGEYNCFLMIENSSKHFVTNALKRSTALKSEKDVHKIFTETWNVIGRQGVIAGPEYIPNVIKKDAELLCFFEKLCHIEACNIGARKMGNLNIEKPGENLIEDGSFDDDDFEQAFEVCFEHNNESILSDLFADLSTSVNDDLSLSCIEISKHDNLNENISVRQRTSSKKPRHLNFDEDLYEDVRRQALMNFNAHGYYLEKNDLLVSALTDLDNAIMVQKTEKKFQKMGSYYDALNLEIMRMKKEHKAYYQRLSKRRSAAGASLQKLSLNCATIKRRQAKLISLQDRARLSKYDTLDKIGKIRANILHRDIDLVSDMSKSIIDIMEKKIGASLRVIISDPLNHIRALAQLDFDQKSKMYTQYGLDVTRFIEDQCRDAVQIVTTNCSTALDAIEDVTSTLKSLQQIASEKDLIEDEISTRQLSMVVDRDPNFISGLKIKIDPFSIYKSDKIIITGVTEISTISTEKSLSRDLAKDLPVTPIIARKRKRTNSIKPGPLLPEGIEFNKTFTLQANSPELLGRKVKLSK